jgi:hypothetical protein
MAKKYRTAICLASTRLQAALKAKIEQYIFSFKWQFSRAVSRDAVEAALANQ